MLRIHPNFFSCPLLLLLELIHEDAILVRLPRTMTTSLGNRARVGDTILVVSVSSIVTSPTNVTVDAKCFIFKLFCQHSAMFEDCVVSGYAAHINIVRNGQRLWCFIYVTANGLPFVPENESIFIFLVNKYCFRFQKSHVILTPCLAVF